MKHSMRKARVEARDLAIGDTILTKSTGRAYGVVDSVPVLEAGLVGFKLYLSTGKFQRVAYVPGRPVYIEIPRRTA